MCKASLIQSQIRSTNRHRSLSSSHSIGLTHTRNSHTTGKHLRHHCTMRTYEVADQSLEGKQQKANMGTLVRSSYDDCKQQYQNSVWRGGSYNPLPDLPSNIVHLRYQVARQPDAPVHGIVLDGYVGVERRQASLPYKTPSWTNHPFIFSLQWVCCCPCSRPQCVGKLACCPSHLEDSIDSLFKVKNFVQQYAHIMLLFVEQNQS